MQIMEFTWRHVIILAEKMFYLSDADVADRLKLNRSTIFRHKQEGNNSKFRVSCDIYSALFQPTESNPVSLDNLKNILNGDDFPASVRNLEFTEYEQYIRFLLNLADKAEKAGESTQPPELDSSGFGKQSTYGLAIDSPGKKVQSVWEPEPVSMPEEFYECFNKYAIADFVELDPMNLILINYMVAEERLDGETIIKNAIQFVKDIENAMQHTEISFWNEKVCKVISVFIKWLREYIDFLMENAESPNFAIHPFLLAPVDTEEFERKTIEHRRKLQSAYKQITDVEGRWSGLQMFSNFPGR